MKTILITGASSGIGAELSKLYLEKGENVILIARNIEKMDVIANDYPNTSLVMACDIRDQKLVSEKVNLAFKKFGRIDIAILNAAVSVPFEFENFDMEILRNTYETNLFGVANFLQPLIDQLKDQGHGKIVSIGSQADVRGFPLAGAYSSSKAALNIFMEAARIELSKYNIEVQLIRPGFIWTPMIEGNDYPMPFLISVEKGAKIIFKAISKNKKVFTFPWKTKLLTQLTKYSPNWLFDRIGDYKKYKRKN